jgi:hypothetical protein
MLKNRRSLAIILLVLSIAGLAQFARHVRAVDAVGLFATGAMAGAAICMFTKRGKREPQ